MSLKLGKGIWEQLDNSKKIVYKGPPNPYKNKIKILLDEELLSNKHFISLMKMIDSGDLEARKMAEGIIDTLPDTKAVIKGKSDVISNFLKMHKEIEEFFKR